MSHLSVTPLARVFYLLCIIASLNCGRFGAHLKKEKTYIEKGVLHLKKRKNTMNKFKGILSQQKENQM